MLLPLKPCPARLWSPHLGRHLHSPPPLRQYSLPRLSPTVFTLLGCGIAGGTWYLKSSPISADALEVHKPSKTQTPLSTLLRSYTVYTFCSIPVLVDHSPSILAAFLTIPGVKQVTVAIIRSTFFAQFVGGDSAEDTIPLLNQLREENKGVLLAYSVEVDQDEAEGKDEKRALRPSSEGHTQNVEETIRCIDVAADFEDRQSAGAGRKTWVALKLTALLPSAQSLINLSDHLRQSRPQSSTQVPFPGFPHSSDLAFIDSGAPPPSTLTKNDIAALKELYVDLSRIAERAQQRGVKIIVDAEYTWYQPAIDAFTFSLMRRFNSLPCRPEPVQQVQPLVYATFQAYLKRTPSHIQKSFQDAKTGKYALGVKLVRGAYHPFEVEAAPSSAECPVWASKPETDACYDECAGVLLSALKDDISSNPIRPQIGILFGTHNASSCTMILDGLIARNVAEERGGGQVVVPEAVADRCAIGQLFGMSDSLTDSLADKVHSSSPFVFKYVPLVIQVMPYLSRRAIENKSILSGVGGAAAERRRVGAEIRLRVLGF